MIYYTFHSRGTTKKATILIMTKYQIFVSSNLGCEVLLLVLSNVRMNRTHQASGVFVGQNKQFDGIPLSFIKLKCEIFPNIL